MKKENLKALIKPLIKECLMEVLVEEGFTKLISETVRVTPQPVQQIRKQMVQQDKPASLVEAKKKMLDAIGSTGFDAFAGTQPLKEDKEIMTGDSGVDISKLLENKQVWKQTLNAMNGKKVKE
jgi:hypothetical protein